MAKTTPKRGFSVELSKIFLFSMMITLSGSLWAMPVPSGDSPANYSQADVYLLVAYVLLALVFSFTCSVAEAVLLTMTPSYIAGLEEKNPKKAKLLRRLKQDNVDRSLAAILTLNTIAHTVGAIGSGSKATAVFGSAWFGVFSAVMTLMILFLSEIIPKTIGAFYWRQLSYPTALFVRGLSLVLYPILLISEKLTQLISHGKKVHTFSREEFIAMAGVGERAGRINERESRIINNLFRFNSIRAMDIMTPRTVIVAVQQDTTIAELLAEHSKAIFSRMPLFKENLDDIQSFILRDDLLNKAQSESETPLVKLKRDLMAVPAHTHLSELLEFLLMHRQQMVMIVDEYGGTKGLVTMEDVVETLLGMEIMDETDKVEDMQVLARNKWAERAKTLGLDVDSLLPPPE